MSEITYLIQSTNNKLKKNNIDSSKLESELMISNIIGCKNRINLYTQYDDKKLNPKQLKQLNNYIKRRISGEPIQYILNNASFYGRNFFVDNNVLIPRFDSELLIEILKKQHSINTLLEIGTGSGNLSITIMKENLAKSIISTDICKKKIDIAKYNAKQICGQINIEFIIDDFFNTTIHNKFDAIISNPPYIPIKELEKLDNLVKNNEPLDSLTDYGDGYNFYQQFAIEGKKKLNKNGFILLEIGIDNHLKKIRDIFCDYKVEYFHDLNKIPRIIKIY